MNRFAHRALAALFVALFASPLACSQPIALWMQREMPSRPPIAGIWEPLSLPMRQADIAAMSRRLELTHEQRVAVERRFETYLADACAARSAANEALATVDFTIFDMPEIKPAEAEVAKYVRARESFNRELARLDAALFDEIEPTLGDQQKAVLPRERLRRDRMRCLTDGSVISWSSQQQVLIELREVVDELSLPPAQREAIEPLLNEFESQATRRLIALQNAATEFRMKWLRTEDEEDQFWGPWRKVSEPMVDAVLEIMAMEYEFVDRIGGLLEPDQAANLRRRHTFRIDYATDWLDWPMFEIWASTALGDETLTEEQRTTLATRIDLARREREAALPEYFAVDRRMRAMQLIRLNGRGMFGPLSYQQSKHFGVRAEHEAASQRTHEGYVQLREFIKRLLGEERGQAINDAASEANNRHNESKSEIRGEFEQGNFVTMISYWGRPEVIASSAVPRADHVVLRAAGVDDELLAVLGSVFADSSDHRRRIWEAFIAESKPLLEHSGREFDPDAAAQQGDLARQRLQELVACSGPGIEAIRTVVPEAELADRVVAADQWAMIAAPPRNCPAPMQSVRSSHWPTITSRLDAVDPAAALVASGASMTETAAAGRIVCEGWPQAARLVGELRRAMLDVYLANDTAFEFEQWRQRQMQAGNQQGARDDREFKEREKAEAAATLAQRLRREHLASLAQLHERIAATLAPDHAAAYREFVGRAAHPDAYRGVEAARIVRERALALVDLTSESRRAIEAEWIELHARLVEHAQVMESMIFDYAMASDMTENADQRCAPLYARIEQACFERDEAAAGVHRMLRRILTAAQMQVLETPGTSH